MLNVILAVMIAVGGSAILVTALGFLLVTVLGLSADVAKSLIGVGALPAFAVKNVYEVLEASSAKRAPAKTGLNLTSVSEFSIHPLSAFLFSFIMWSGALFFTGALMGLAVGMAQGAGKIDIDIIDSQPMFFTALVVFTAFPLRVIAAVYIGCWIGTRSRPYVLAIVFGSIALGVIAYFLYSLWALSSEFKAAIFNNRGALEQFTTSLVPDMVIFMIFAALGFWYGQRQKPTYYLAFIMKTLPQDTGQTIVEMAQDEARRTRRPTMQAAS